MEDVKEKKQKLRNEVSEHLAALPKGAIEAKSDQIEEQLFDFANFVESETALFYFRSDNVINTRKILERCNRMAKAIVLPSFAADSRVRLWKISNLETDLKSGGNLIEPDPERCKPIAFDSVDIAIVPGTAFDEKGARLGSGDGLYDRLIPKLPATARKVALALEDQIVSHVPMESHDKYVDIIITDKRVIYKI